MAVEGLLTEKEVFDFVRTPSEKNINTPVFKPKCTSHVWGCTEHEQRKK